MSYSSFEEMAIANGWNEQQQHAELAASHYDLYKEVNGIRPRWINYEEMSINELINDIEQLSNEAQYIEERESDAEYAARLLEKSVQMMIICGAPDRRAAERWARQAR